MQWDRFPARMPRFPLSGEAGLLFVLFLLEGVEGGQFLYVHSRSLEERMTTSLKSTLTC